MKDRKVKTLDAAELASKYKMKYFEVRYASKQAL